MKLMNDRTAEIQRELAELNNTLKMSVKKAIRIGELLTEQKEIVGHGLFIQWIESNLDIGQVTAHKYMNLHQYQNKISLSENLQDAYKQIETIEAQARLSKEERDRKLIAEYRKTGKKPDGWDRSLDYRIQKDKESEVKQKERIDRELKEREQRAAEYKEHQKSLKQQSENNNLADAFQSVASAFVEKSNQRNEWKEKIRLSDGGKEDAFMDAIIDYMETLENDTRRIEACNNIIKICRNIAVELQRKAA